MTFWGAARTVTGSMHLVRANGRQVLLDCGLFQGKRSEARERNRDFPFAPRELTAVILSHAHIDHCGNLPNLVRQGFSGPIFCTAATRDLLAVMLADSAKIQEEDAAYLNRKKPPSDPPIQPLYQLREVHRTVALAETVPFDRPFNVCDGMEGLFVEAGHLLGSAMLHLRMDTGGWQRSLSFTGDLGRKGLPILRDPAALPPADLVISESTYGGRRHAPLEQLLDALADVVRRTIERGGKLLIPAFSLGRTQSIVYDLHQLMQAGRIKDLGIFVDSPLAANATEVFRLHPECFDEETGVLWLLHPDLFGQERVRYLHTVEESKQLNSAPGPCIIIAASGMCESGRILHHLKHNIEDARNTVLIIGFQAPNTLGRRIVEKSPEVRILGKTLKLRAEVVTMNGFSSHADHDDLLSALTPLRERARQVCLVHGEVPAAEALAGALRTAGFRQVTIPDRGEVVAF